METKRSFSNYLAYTLMIVFGILGGLIGFYTIYQYKVVVNGFLGLVIFYLTYQLFLKQRGAVHGSAELVYEFPRDLKLILWGFFWCIILSWASANIIDMVFALIK